jgi:quercetin dioxygenase-like cupin family protein
MNTRILLASAAVVVACALTVVSGQDGKAVRHVSSKTGEWKPMGAAPSVSTIAIHGDMTKGAHSMFAKFEPGADHGWHKHTADVTLVVISGAYLFKGEDGKEIRVGPGEYLFVPGGMKHWSGGDKKEGAIFFQESPAPFDLIKAEK